MPLLVGNSKIQARPKAITRPTPTSNGIPTHNNAVVLFFIKSPENKRYATVMVAYLCGLVKLILLKVTLQQAFQTTAMAGLILVLHRFAKTDHLYVFSFSKGVCEEYPFCL